MKIQIQRGAALSHPVELRDVLPTFLDAVGKPIPPDMDGASLLKLMRDENTPWRSYIDLEHSACYRDENYWAALTDGKIKYIYHFYHGREQLFNLGDDPGELHDHAENPQFADTLINWRERMIDHLSERGPKWVKNGQLRIRKKTMLYSSHYPKK